MGMSTLLERSRTEVGVVAERRTDLTLDLFTCPSSSVSCSAAEVCVCACLPRHRGEEIMAEVLPEVTSWESICKVAGLC
jgi:ornithine carbamoyltransferase